MANRDVLVIGGGVAGIQAALDLADMGVNVHLLERQPSIGGRMVQLDTIFPTNCHGGCRHCSVGIVLDEPADCSRHPNIVLHTCSEVEQVMGDVGDFTVRVVEQPRFVDPEKCTACGACAKVCPVVVPDEFNEGLSSRRAIYLPHEQAVPNAYLVSKRGTPPCEVACPLSINPQGYISLVAEGRYGEALEVIRRDNPFPATVGRVCDHPCEAACIRGRSDQPVAICALERFVADQVYAEAERAGERPGASPSQAPSRDARRVAIVGAGPTGLSAAYFLAQDGYRVTIFEAWSVAGGMMRLTVPPYRLPRNVLQWEIDHILDLGVELKLYSPVSDVAALFDDGYEAVFVAIGAHESHPLEIPGGDAEGIHQAVPFLKAVSLGQQIEVGPRVVVLGDDDTAVCAARCATRLGATEVVLVCDRAVAEMRVNPREIDHAVQEGVRLVVAKPMEVLSSDGRITGVRCLSVPIEPPSIGALHPSIPPHDGEVIVDADTLIVGVPQVPEVSFLKPDHGFGVTLRGTVAVNPLTLETDRPGVFAGGDAVRAPGTLAEAIADGRRAAQSIGRYLDGMPLADVGEQHPLPVADLAEDEIAKLVQGATVSAGQRAVSSTTPLAERTNSFQEVDLGLTEEQARSEAQRCLQCGGCAECGLCIDVCDPKCIDLDMAERAEDLQVGAIVLATGFEPFDPSVLTPYGYGKYKNVITSLEFERLISASGPTQGRLLRPSDGTPAKQLAFIQCVGSRDLRHHQYCSSVCCMFATQEAIVANARDPEVRSTIFYRDMRAAGKGFEDPLTALNDDQSVSYIRARVAEISLVGDDRLLLSYDDIESAGAGARTVDMVVLVVGLAPRRGAQELASVLGIELDEHSFVRTHPFSPTDTTREGVFACGFCRGPADISEAVAQASAAAARAAEVVVTTYAEMRG